MLGDLAKLYTEFMPSFLSLQTSNISSPCLTLPRLTSLLSTSLIKQLQDPLALFTIQVLWKALNQKKSIVKYFILENLMSIVEFPI